MFEHLGTKIIFFGRKYLGISLSALLLIRVLCCQAQEEDRDKSALGQVKGFHAGLFAGTLFANKHTASLYNGYGYDFNSNKNDFANSWMSRKIIFEFGGGNGQPDRIALALNVNHNDWSFNESDMPVNLRYNIALMIGAQTRYCFNSKDAIIFNINATKLIVNGDFTITLTNPNINPTTPGYINYKTFSIIGAEQRLVFQLGYQRILGDEENSLNVFIEGGAVVSMAKFDNNKILINNLEIELTTFYNNIGYVDYRAKNLTGVGFGAFAGVGLNLNASPKWTLQLLYNPSLESINIGSTAKRTLQQTAGLRAYYNL